MADQALQVITNWAWRNRDIILQTVIGSLCSSTWREYKHNSIYGIVEEGLTGDAFEMFLRERPLMESLLLANGMSKKNADDLLRLCPKMQYIYGPVSWPSASVLCKRIKELTIGIGPYPLMPAKPIEGCVAESLTIKLLNPGSVHWWRSLNAIVLAMPGVRTLTIDMRLQASLQDLVTYVPASITRLKVLGTLTAKLQVEGVLPAVTCLELERGTHSWMANCMDRCFPNLREFSYLGQTPVVLNSHPDNLETINVSQPLNLSSKSKIKNVTLWEPVSSLDMYILVQDYPLLEFLSVKQPIHSEPHVFNLSYLETDFMLLRKADMHADMMVADCKRIEELRFDKGCLLLLKDCSIRSLDIGELGVCSVHDTVEENSTLESIRYCMGFGGGADDLLLKSCVGLKTVEVWLGDLSVEFAHMEMKRLCGIRGFVLGPRRLRRMRKFVATLDKDSVSFTCDLYTVPVGESPEYTFVVTQKYNDLSNKE